MAGSFGFDKNKYTVSRQIGELVLLPEVRAASRDTLVITNGYSCREQIEQCSDRKALRLADLLQLAITIVASRVRDFTTSREWRNRRSSDLRR